MTPPRGNTVQDMIISHLGRIEEKIDKIADSTAKTLATVAEDIAKLKNSAANNATRIDQHEYAHLPIAREMKEIRRVLGLMGITLILLAIIELLLVIATIWLLGAHLA